MHFRTQEVSQLYEQLKEWGNLSNPFLDREYSLGSFAPVTDLTPYIAAWLAHGRAEPLEELWSYIAPDTSAAKSVLRKGMNVSLPSGLRLSEIQFNEIRAIYILSSRCALIHGAQDAPFVARILAASSLSCEPLPIDPEMTRRLVKATKSEVREGSPCDVTRGPAGAAAFSVEKLQSARPETSDVTARLKLIPPMTRLVLHDYVHRSWSQGRLRLDMYYGERMYGCSGGWNRHYLEWTEFFLPPSDEGEVPSPVTKDILKRALDRQGIAYKKSDSRNTLIETARTVPGLLAHLKAESAPEVRSLHPHWSTPVKAWSDHLRAVEAASSGVLKMMAIAH